MRRGWRLLATAASHSCPANRLRTASRRRDADSHRHIAWE